MKKEIKYNIQADNTQPNTASDAQILPKKRILKTFNSFEEENEATAKDKGSISPEQHIANATQRIKDIYPDELKMPMDKTLRFRDD